MGDLSSERTPHHPVFEFRNELPEIERLWHVEGVIELEVHCGDAFFGEIFSGCAACTLCAVVLGVPAIFPWDTEYGHIYDVCRGGWIWLRLSAERRLGATHTGTPCRSMTWSRSPQLRSWNRMFGCSEGRNASLVHVGSLLVMFTCLLAAFQLAYGGFFGTENPWRSWLWFIPWALNLRRCRGVGLSKFFFGDYFVSWSKPSGLMHNSPTLFELHSDLPSTVADVILRGQIWWEGQWVFKTHLAQPYPPAFAMYYMELVQRALALRAEARAEARPVEFALPEHRAELPAQEPSFFLVDHNILPLDEVDLQGQLVEGPGAVEQAAIILGMPPRWALAFLPDESGRGTVADLPLEEANFEAGPLASQMAYEDTASESGESEGPPALLEHDDDASSECSSVSDMSEDRPGLVPDGGGAAVGMTEEEHLEWGRYVHEAPPPFDVEDIEEDLFRTLSNSCSLDPTEIDQHRLHVCLKILERSIALEDDRRAWREAAAPHVKRIFDQFHGPLYKELLEHAGYEESGLAESAYEGFRLAGVMDPSGPEISENAPRVAPLSEAELRQQRPKFNAVVLERCRASQYEDQWVKETLKDIEHGSMTPLVPLTDEHVANFNLSRRFVVAQWDPFKEKTKFRMIDDFTESGVNLSCQQVDRTSCQALDRFLAMTGFLLKHKRSFSMWKRDVKRAFKNCAVATSQLDLCGAVLFIGGEYLFSQHLALPFGAVGSVLGWHRIGGSITTILARLLWVALGRYVDDFYGVDVDGVTLTGGMCMDFVCTVLGLPLDADKAENGCISMLLLGARVQVDFALWAVSTQVAEEKAACWSEDVLEALASDSLPSGPASKMAGRFSFAVTTAYDRVGRAYIRPLHRQSHSPRPRLAPDLRQSLLWWLSYLTARPTRWFFPGRQRDHAVMWTDASGEDGTVAAVLAADGELFFTYLVVPPEFMSQLYERGDKQIGVLEALAIWLGISTFEDRLRGRAWSLFEDNQGVMRGLIRGSSRSPECNIMFAKVWLWNALTESHMTVYYVETHANIADGPTRGRFGPLLRASAVEVSPVLPAWAFDLWSQPSLDDFAQEVLASRDSSRQLLVSLSR